MSFSDRQYYGNQGDEGGYGGRSGGMGIGLPKPSGMVKWLLIINVAMFVIQILSRGRIEEYFAVVAVKGGWELTVQVWRLITFQFLHSRSGVFHIIMNMLGLYFLGPLLERTWGAKRFLIFYLSCGLVGGLLYSILGTAGIFGSEPGVLVGASGGLLGLLVACAILFPGIRVVLFIFPVPIRAAALLFAVVYIYNVLIQGQNAGGDLCHLGGMITGFIWVKGLPMLNRMRQQRTDGSWKRKLDDEQKLQFEVDRILAKVRERGLGSLSEREKKTLAEATERQRREMM